MANFQAFPGTFRQAQTLKFGGVNTYIFRKFGLELSDIIRKMSLYFIITFQIIAVAKTFESVSNPFFLQRTSRKNITCPNKERCLKRVEVLDLLGRYTPRLGIQKETMKMERHFSTLQSWLQK